MNRIAQYDKETFQLLRIFETYAQASKETGINPDSISRCLKGEYQTASKFVWRKYNPPVGRGDYTFFQL